MKVTFLLEMPQEIFSFGANKHDKNKDSYSVVFYDTEGNQGVLDGHEDKAIEDIHFHIAKKKNINNSLLKAWITSDYSFEVSYDKTNGDLDFILKQMDAVKNKTVVDRWKKHFGNVNAKFRKRKDNTFRGTPGKKKKKRKH